ncbi:MAG TPA: peptide chain release factor N(5)-glutamine methyltransferase [Sediminibacterium sp.]|nr:peptide chain release factor N(5)-glutamine methyltransferase [Sediminibacterium sp.]
MTIREGKQLIKEAILALYDEREAGNIATLLMEWISGKNRMEQLMDKDLPLTSQQADQLLQAGAKLRIGEPVQYIIGEAWFMGQPFLVTRNTLIPRPETEELVEWMMKDLAQQATTRLRMLEVGSGTGCIPISLKKKFPELQVQSVDISRGAIQTARENAARLHAAVDFIEMDFLTPANREQLGQTDLIVSNPPYIKASERESMHKNVVEFEPATALFVPDQDALIFYKAIRNFSETHLTPNGKIYLEINQQLGKDVLQLFNNGHFSAVLQKDLQGNDRMIRAVRLAS